MLFLMLLKQNWQTLLGGQRDVALATREGGSVDRTWYPQGQGLKFRSERSNSSMQRGLGNPLAQVPNIARRRMLERHYGLGERHTRYPPPRRRRNLGEP